MLPGGSPTCRSSIAVPSAPPALPGTAGPAGLRGLQDADGAPIAGVLAEGAVELRRAPGAASRQDLLSAYLELHIEQGPVLEDEGLRAAAVSGCAGVERHLFR